MKPARIEFRLGQNVYGQPVRLVRERDGNGREVWTIYRDEADQRDDRSHVSGLTPDLIRLMAEAMKEFP